MDAEITDVVSSLNGEAVLLTGGTGFLGKVLIEKLLRTCPAIKHLYLLARHKKGLSVENRFQEIFKDPLFSTLEKQDPDFRTKVSPVYGDCALPELGIAQQDKELLLSEVGIVVHSAATVRFDESLRVAYDTNIRGTKELLLLAKQMKHLKAFVHISTAYSHCYRNHVEETLYDSPMDYKKLELVVDNLDDNLLQSLVGKMLGEWPNTYTYTKAIAENMVVELGRGMPLVIFRPAVVVGTAYEPVKGWMDNVYGPTGLVIGAGVGILHSIQGDINGHPNVVPVDMTVSAILVATAEIIQRHANKSSHHLQEKQEEAEAEKKHGGEDVGGPEVERPTADKATDEDPPIYNYVSTTDNPITWRQFKQYLEIHGEQMPTVRAVWCYFLFIHFHWLPHRICVALFHYLPAILIDAFTAVTGANIPNMMKIYGKVDKFSDALMYFSTRSWTFTNDNVRSLWTRLNPCDRQRFDFNIASLDWDQFFCDYVRGVRIYLLKDDLSTVAEGKLKLARFRLAQKAIIFFLSILSALLGYALVSKLYARIYNES